MYGSTIDNTSNFLKPVPADILYIYPNPRILGSPVSTKLLSAGALIIIE